MIAIAGSPGSPPAAEVDVGAGALRPGEPLGVYVHFPFCGVRCPYCDFAVDTRAGIPHDAYADAVVAEIAARRGWYEGAGPLASIYFGGGTPGLWRADALARVIEAARAAFDAAAAPDAPEITVEVNPGESDEAHLRALRGHGVNRLSIGVQAFDDRLLRGLGRNHDAAAGPACVRAARAAGFDNLSIDLMFGVPEQSFDDWRRAVDLAIGLAPDHVSAYALTVERGTAFGSLARAGRLARPDDEAVAAMFEHARAAFAAAGLEPYEISSYARPRSAVAPQRSLLVAQPVPGGRARPRRRSARWPTAAPGGFRTRARPTSTCATATPRHVERRTAADLENEAVWLGLRTAAGIDRAAHRARHGVDPVVGRDLEVERAVAAGWLIVDEVHVQLTPAGVLFADEVAARLWR